MPASGTKNPAGAFGQPIGSNVGLNEQQVIEVTNNSGTWLHHGDVVVWDENTALSSVTPVLVNANFTLTTASQTITANASTASYASSGGLLIPVTVTGTAGTNTVPVFVAYSGISGSTFTGATAAVASVTNGAQANASIFQWPTASYSNTAGAGNTNTQTSDFGVYYKQSVVSLAAAPADGGRYVTYSNTAAVKDPQVAGVVTVDASAATETGFTPGLLPSGAFPNAPIAPGQNCFICTGGVARVNIGAATVAANTAICTATIPGQAAAGTPTLGNLLGISLEAQSAKDANNTIRCIIKIG